MDREAWRAIVHTVAELDMTEQLTHTHTHTHPINETVYSYLYLSINPPIIYLYKSSRHHFVEEYLNILFGFL